MKKYFLHILWVSLLGVLAVSCSDEQESLGFDSSKAQVVFSVAMDTPISRTRAAGDDNTWGSDYTSHPGDEYDNRIDMDQLVVEIVDGTGQIKYNVTDILQWKSDTENNVYKFVGIVDGINQFTVLCNPKIKIYANMGKTVPAETFEQGAAYIPMWGMKTVISDEKNQSGDNILKFTPGTRTDLGQISLLRAMAKLEVKLNSEMATEFELAGATLNKYNSTGYTHPTLPVSFNGSTENLDLEGVLNPTTTDGQDLALEPTKDSKSYVVYLPEVKNDGTTEEDLLKISVKLKEKSTGNVEEGSFFIKDYSDADNPVAIDIIRNHWYQYTIKGFAASEIQVSYNTVPWTDENIYIGGEGFLYLNPDVIEIYNSNIDSEQLKFYSSTPIKSITLKDLYSHDRDGNIVEGNADGVSAYYLSKYGQKIQLGTDPGFSITDKEAALAREQVILSKIKAEAQADALKGGITITSPFLADPTNEITELQQSSHYDTPRYLEFEVINEDSLKATFRVIQYPPVVVTNTEGFFSYREDFRIDIPYQYYSSQFPEAVVQRKPFDNGEPTHFLNPVSPFFFIAGFFPYHIHKWDNEKGRIMVSKGKYGGSGGKSCGVFNDAGTTIGSYLSFDETPYGTYGRDHMRLDEYKGAPVTSVFHRTHYKWSDGTDFINGKINADGTINDPSKYYQNVSPPYYELEDKVVTDEETGVVSTVKEKVYYVRHYTGNLFAFFYAKYVGKVHKENTATRYKGESDMYTMWPSDNYDAWGPWQLSSSKNHRMYHIKTTAYSPTYILGWPKMITIKDYEKDSIRVYTAEGEDNARMVSPSLMIASQLGTTTVPQNRDHYTVPLAEGMYNFAQRQCEQYAEAYYTDMNGDGEYTAGIDSVTHFTDWRLPTRAEIELIVNLQRNSRAMDKVLYGEKYFHASIMPNDYDDKNTLFSLDKVLDQWTSAGYQMRCVRDVKPGQEIKRKIYPLTGNN